MWLGSMKQIRFSSYNEVKYRRNDESMFLIYSLPRVIQSPLISHLCMKYSFCYWPKYGSNSFGTQLIIIMFYGTLVYLTIELRKRNLYNQVVTVIKFNCNKKAFFLRHTARLHSSPFGIRLWMYLKNKTLFCIFFLICGNYYYLITIII